MPPSPPSTTPIPAIGYIRVSLLLEQQISPEIQRNAITEWARRTNRHIVRWIEDLDVSGRNFHRKIMDGIEAIEAGEAREIAVWKYSRFGRNRTGCAVNLGRITMAGGELQSATEEVDSSTATGKLTRGMLMELAAFESDRTGEQWAEAHATRHAHGLPSHGRDRFGYLRRGRAPDPLQPHRTIRDPADGLERYEINPDTGPILAELYRRYIAGEGARALVATLNGAGLLTTRGKHWSDTAIKRYLDSGWGAGLLRVHDPNCDCRAAGPCTNKVLIQGAHDAVITPTEWQAFRRRRARVAETPPRARVSVYPLSGRVRCGHCGERMSAAGREGEPGWWYRCGGWLRKRICKPRSVQRSKLEVAVLAQLAVWAHDIEADAATGSVPPLEQVVDVSRLHAELAVADAAIKRLTLQVAKGLVSEEDYPEAHAELLAERSSIAAQLEPLEQPRTRERHEFLPVIEALLAEWSTWHPAARREVLADLISVVRVFRTDRRTSWVEIVSEWGETCTVEL